MILLVILVKIKCIHEEYTNTYGIGDKIYPINNINVKGGYIRLFESMEESEIDFDVQKYSQLLDTNNSIEYIGTSNQYHDLFHSDILILKKILQFKGKKLALLKFDKIACVFLDFNFLIRALFELDFQHYSDSSPVDAIIDIDTCQAVYLNYTEAYQVYSNF